MLVDGSGVKEEKERVRVSVSECVNGYTISTRAAVSVRESNENQGCASLEMYLSTGQEVEWTRVSVMEN